MTTRKRENVQFVYYTKKKKQINSFDIIKYFIYLSYSK